MADLNKEGTAPANPVKENDSKEGKTKSVKEKKVQEELKDTSDMFKLIPSQSGNEMVAIIKILATMNKNLSFLANTIYLHLNPEVKDGRSTKQG